MYSNLTNIHVGPCNQVGGRFFLKFNKHVVPNKSVEGLFHIYEGENHVYRVKSQKLINV